MNSTQKLAWILLFSALFAIAAFIYVGAIIVSGHMPPRPFGQIIVGSTAIVGFGLLALTLFMLARRQSPAEPEADERDKRIRRNAATISFAGSWILLVAVILVLGLALGQTGTIPVYLLTVILAGVATVTMLVCGVAILIQYGRRVKDE